MYEKIEDTVRIDTNLYIGNYDKVFDNHAFDITIFADHAFDHQDQMKEEDNMDFDEQYYADERDDVDHHQEQNDFAHDDDNWC